MERLTSKYGKGHKAEMANKSKIIERLGEYEDLEEQGLLLRFPCKVGDVFFDMYTGNKVFATKVALKQDSKYEIHFQGKGTYFDVSDKEIGKRYFKTQEEAEQALTKMNGGGSN